MNIPLKQLQHEILEAERLIERNNIIIGLHLKNEELNKRIAELEKERSDVN